MKQLLYGLGILLLLITTIIFGVRSVTHASAAAEAEAMSHLLVATLQELDYPRSYPACRAIRPGLYEVIGDCLRESRESTDLSALFREDQFRDAAGNESGYLVIENAKGGRSFESEAFRLLHNNQEASRGCATPGRIAPGFTCRLTLPEACAPGDNLEVQYEGKRLFLKTC